MQFALGFHCFFCRQWYIRNSWAESSMYAFFPPCGSAISLWQLEISQGVFTSQKIPESTDQAFYFILTSPQPILKKTYQYTFSTRYIQSEENKQKNRFSHAKTSLASFVLTWFKSKFPQAHIYCTTSLRNKGSWGQLEAEFKCTVFVLDKGVKDTGMNYLLQ